MKSLFPLIALLMFCTGCSGVGRLTSPDLKIPDRFSDNREAEYMSIADMEWYQFYTDSTLRTMIGRTLANNRDLLSAAAKVDEMRALYGVTRAEQLPELSALAGGNLERTDYNGSGWSGDPEYSLKATLNWEVNLWGAMSWARRKGMAAYKASVEDLRAMQITLIANTASAYLHYIAMNSELAIVKETLRTHSEALEQARIRFEGGLTSETVYQQAKVEYSSTASLVPNLERQIALARNALTILMGEFPVDELPVGTMFLDYHLPDSVDVGIPSAILQRRPDIRAAEQRLASAMANVGLTYANRFPSFRISLTGGLENEALTDFLKSPYTYIIGNLTGPIFDFGKRKKKYEAAIAQYEQARLAYEKVVITSFSEVNNALTAYSKYQENYALKVSLREAAWKYVELSRLQYRAGSLNYLDVLDAQRRHFDAQIGESNALLDRYTALIDLYKALGGGW